MLIPSNHVFSQESFNSYLPNKKIYLFQTTRQTGLFSSSVSNRTNRAMLSFCLPYRMLLEADADLNHVTSNGTCLHEAALYGKTEVVKTLLEVNYPLQVPLSY